MKRILSFILSVLFVTFSIHSCAEYTEAETPVTQNPNPNDPDPNPNDPDPNPNDPDPNPTPTIVAKWKKVGITDVQGVDIAYHDHECATIYDYLQFSSNGTAKDVSYLTDCVTTEEDSGSYILNGTTLTMVANDPNGNLMAGDMTILELTNTSLKLKVEPLDFVLLFESY